MRLEMDKKYKTRDNKIVTIIGFNCNKDYPYLGDNDAHYLEDGRYVNDYVNSCYDLMEEIVENDSFVEVGKTYLNRSGERITIILKDSKTNSRFPYISNKGHTFSANGKYWFNSDSPQDLIEEYKPISLEIGKQYVCRNGKTVTIIKKIEDYYEEDDLFIGNNSVAYLFDGSLCCTVPDNLSDNNEIIKGVK